MTTKRLGRGLADLIETPSPAGGKFVMLRTEQIRTGRLQPRATFSAQALEELQESIRRQGILEPIIVRPVAHGTYEVVAGERRFRAAQALGMSEVPAVIKALSDKEALELSLIENGQREDLNPLEEARGYARLSEEFGYTQEQIAEAVGKDRATIANALRVLKLPAEIQEALGAGTISAGHAKALLAIADPGAQLALWRRTVKQALSVRQLERLVGAWGPAKRRRVPRRADPHLLRLEDELRRALGTKVRLVARGTGGRLIIEYFSDEDLARLLKALGVSG